MYFLKLKKYTNTPNKIGVFIVFCMCMHRHMYLHMHVFLSIMYIHTHMCIYIHTHTYFPNLSFFFHEYRFYFLTFLICIHTLTQNQSHLFKRLFSPRNNAITLWMVYQCVCGVSIHSALLKYVKTEISVRCFPLSLSSLFGGSISHWICSFSFYPPDWPGGGTPSPTAATLVIGVYCDAWHVT